MDSCRYTTVVFGLCVRSYVYEETRCISEAKLGGQTQRSSANGIKAIEWLPIVLQQWKYGLNP